MDITQSTEPRSDQQNFDDYAAGITRTVTITEVKHGSAEQPIEVHLAEYPGRPYKPSKSMRRVFLAAWGADTAAYTGRRIKLYGDPTVKFGGVTLGGIKIAAMSDIEKPLSLALTVTRGKRAAHTVEPLVESQGASSEPTKAQVAASTDIAELKVMWKSSGAERRAQIEARVKELDENPVTPDPADELPVDA